MIRLCIAAVFALLPFAALGQAANPETLDDFATHRVQTAPAVNLFVRDGGSGPALILLHGWPQYGLMWHTVAPALAQNFRVIVPDMRGAGSSSIPPGGYDKVTMAADIIAVMDALEIKTAHVAGYDLGSGVAYALAAGHRDRVERLAVMEFGLPGFGYESFMTPSPEWDNGANWHLGLFTLPDIAQMAFGGKERELLSWFFWHLAHDGEAVRPEHFEAYVRAVQRPGALRAGFMYYATVWQDAKDNARLAADPLTIPVLGVGGAMSAGPYVAQLFKPVAANVTGAVIPHAGHWLGDENPQALIEILSGFFSEHGALIETTDQHDFKQMKEMNMLKRFILISCLFLWPVAGMADVAADMAIQRGPAERLTPQNTVLIYVDYTAGWSHFQTETTEALAEHSSTPGRDRACHRQRI